MGNCKSKSKQNDENNLYIAIKKQVHSEDTVNRLITCYSEKNPSETKKWVLEKILYDLERDNN